LRPLARRPLVTGLALLAVVVAGCGGSTRTTQTGGASPAGNLKGSLSGAGATFPAPIYLEWISRYKKTQPGVSINYQGIGSGGGVEQFIAQKIDFGGSDAYMTDAELQAAQKARGCPVVHIPTVFGSVAIAFNVPGLDTITLDGPTLASIFLGKVKTFDDPAIKALNPGVSLPSKAIVVAHRSDGSGTTSIFTKYLASVSPDWKAKAGPGGKTVNWPVGVGGQGNDGVAAAIKQNEGGIGYVELSYALDNQLKTATMKNATGKAVAPSLESTSAAANSAQIPPDLRFSIKNVGGDGYPIVGATWILAYECGYTADKAAALKDFLKWALNSGESVASELHYAPLTPSLKAQSLGNIDKINSVAK
jgi:phosphate transport system substrate-binding protein